MKVDEKSGGGLTHQNPQPTAVSELIGMLGGGHVPHSGAHSLSERVYANQTSENKRKNEEG